MAKIQNTIKNLYYLLFFFVYFEIFFYLPYKYDVDFNSCDMFKKGC